ncbi:MAG: DNA repair protein RecN, partial [Betaproteobacteria bacterium]
GVAAKPLGEIASGGELSRISLAIQSVLHKEAPTSTIIFDEVDTGVGGAVAEVVGRMLREVSDNAQVLCVTHLPQVAALAHSHWRVLKSQSNNTSLTEIELLDFESRVGEVARMLAGATVTEEARAHARQLLEAGRS